ncbi:MAG: c-type cytochrome [Chthoniobacterales bacterium]
MNQDFWLRVHGGSTHFPIVLLAVSVLFDLLGIFWPADSARRGLHAAGFLSAAIGVVVSFGAVASGLIISGWKILGTGTLLRHHQFIWPGFGISVALVIWRATVGRRASLGAFRVYLCAMAMASALILAGAYYGGELALAGNSGIETFPISSPRSADPVLIVRGEHLFLMNCAHCHGKDATGDEGPDLHGIHKTDARISVIVQNGIKGEMPRFDRKLNANDVQALIAFLRSLG